MENRHQELHPDVNFMRIGPIVEKLLRSGSRLPFHGRLVFGPSMIILLQQSLVTANPSHFKINSTISVRKNFEKSKFYFVKNYPKIDIDQLQEHAKEAQ